MGIQGASAAEEVIEEVIVTGSFLKRNAQDSPSPLSVITSADIDDLGAQDISEIVQALPWQSGSQTRATTFGGEGADGRNSINLRNLGHGATLPLVNGKRQVASWYNTRGNASVNVNGLVPNIAIERIEIVKDGASSLYGSDAMAGVVNFITKTDFEGFDLSYEFSTDQETNLGDTNNIQAIWGFQTDKGGVVVSAGALNRDPITIGDRYDRFGGSSASSTGQPGRIQPVGGQTITWAAHGLRPGQAVDAAIDGGAFPRNAQGTSFGQADVDCENSASQEEGGTLGPVFGNLICAYDFGSFFALQAEESLRKFHVTGNYDISDTFEAYFEFAANDAEFDRRNSLNPNALNLTIAPTHPGNIEDAFRRGIVPISVLNRTRLIGGTVNTPLEQRPLNTRTDGNRSDQRIIVGGKWDLNIGDKNWLVDMSFGATEHDSAVTQVQDTLSTEMLLAINGLGGPNCNPVTGTPGEGNVAYAASNGDFLSGACYYFNPFGNSAFDRNGGNQTNLALVNPTELYEWLLGRVTSDTQYRQRVIDIVASGDLFEIGGRTAGLAVGFQRRADSGVAVFDAATNTNNLDFAFGAQDWAGRITATAFFAEIGLPVHDTLELNVAVRYEDFDEIDENTVDPKLSLLWRPIESLSVRGSIGSSFRVGSVQQLFGTQTTVHNMTDVGGDSAFRPAISVGNDQLSPEEAETWNLGISWAPDGGALEGFAVDLDYYSVDYTNIITREDFSTILSNDNAALNAAIAGGQTLVQAIAAGVGNRRQVIRNGQGLLLRVAPDYLNASGAQVSGVDLSTSYTFDTDIGTWRVGVQTAWIREYDTVTPDGNGGFLNQDAVGQYNLRNAVARPLPEFKVNGTINWSLNNHRVFVLGRWVDSYQFPRSEWNSAQGFWNATIGLALGADTASKFADPDISSNFTMDMLYSYTFQDIGWGESSSIALGVKNVFDREPPWVPDNTGFDPSTHDPRGRVFSVKFDMSL